MISRRLEWLLLALLWGPIAANAGTIEILGQGEASLPPDRYTIDLTVTSICYDTTKRAKTDNSTVATELVAIGKKYSESSEDTVNTYPGGFVRNTEYLPDESGHSKILCENGWKTWNTIRIMIHDVQSLPDLQNELVNFLEPMETITPTKKAQTFIQLSSPQFSLTEANLNLLRKQAQQLALADAKAQLTNFDETCKFTSKKLTSLAPPEINTIVRYGAKSANSPESSTPLIPEEIAIRATWNFIWEFEAAPGCYK